MARSVEMIKRPQAALQSYLDALLQEATEELPVLEPEPAPVPAPVPAPAVDDEFAAAVQEEKARDAQVPAPALRAVPAPARSAPVAEPPAVRMPMPAVAPAPEPVRAPEPEPVVERVEPLVEVHKPALDVGQPPPPAPEGRPAWGAEPFECLLFDVAGLTLAVPLESLGAIYSLAGQELTPLFGQPDWFLGILPSKAGNLKVLDTARWVMAERYRDDFRNGLNYVISVQGYDWALAVHQVSRSLRLEPSEIKWRSQRGQRPWLAGTVIEQMCALLDVEALAALIASGATRATGAAPTTNGPR